MDIVELILKIFLIFLASQYILGPFLVWWTQKMPKSYEFNILNADSFLSDRSQIFHQLHSEIIENRFEYIGSSEIKQSNSEVYFSIYYNSITKLCCTLSTAHCKTSNTTQIEFTQMYQDGKVVNINNNPLFEIYPTWDKKICYRFPEINSFIKLLEISNKLLAQHEGSLKVGFDKGNEFKTIEMHLTNELKRLISLGWVSNKISNGKRRLTIKGAILLTWKLCWPIKKILSSIDIRRSRAVLDNA